MIWGCLWCPILRVGGGNIPEFGTLGRVRPGATGVGWELGLAGLAFHIVRPSGPKLDEVAFATSRGGRAFIAGSGEAWGQAAVAAGTATDVAKAAADRTTAFYLGE